MTVPWHPDFAESAAAFLPLRMAAHELRTPVWPSAEDFNRVLASRARRVVNAAGHALRFVAPVPRVREFADCYEPRIYLRGEVQFRPGGWHDIFNALAWLAFPRAKAALNERHHHALLQRHASGEHKGNRSALQDALTLLDESGVVVATSEPELGALLKSHAWKDLFWHRRACVEKHMRFYLFGHGLGEKMLRPFVGVTGRGLICEVAHDLMGLPLREQLENIDAHIAGRAGVAGTGLAVRDLTPVPLLGIPGWCADNEDERYYDNTAYFRALAPRGR